MKLNCLSENWDFPLKRNICGFSVIFFHFKSRLWCERRRERHFLRLLGMWRLFERLLRHAPRLSLNPTFSRTWRRRGFIVAYVIMTLMTSWIVLWLFLASIMTLRWVLWSRRLSFEVGRHDAVYNARRCVKINVFNNTLVNITYEIYYHNISSSYINIIS